MGVEEEGVVWVGCGEVVDLVWIEFVVVGVEGGWLLFLG